MTPSPLAEALPGSPGMYVVVVGYSVVRLPGAIAGAVALATPAPLAIPSARVLLKGPSASIQGVARASGSRRAGS